MEFTADVANEEAWAIAERLEQAAERRGFYAVTAYVHDPDSRVLAESEGSAILVDAVTTRPITPGETRTAITPAGRPSAEDPAVGPRRVGETEF